MIALAITIYLLGVFFTAVHVHVWQRHHLGPGRRSHLATIMLALLWPLAWLARLAARTAKQRP